PSMNENVAMTLQIAKTQTNRETFERHRSRQLARIHFTAKSPDIVKKRGRRIDAIVSSKKSQPATPNPASPSQFVEWKRTTRAMARPLPESTQSIRGFTR